MNIADFKAQRDAHLRRAKLNWEKAKEDKKELDAERVKVDKFIAEWVPYHPNRFYEFDGSYPKIFRKRVDALKAQGKYDDALFLEAQASDMRARQYEEVTIKYFQEKAKEVGGGSLRDFPYSLLQQSLRQARAKRLFTFWLQ